ncbi:MAG: hypothetical protein HOP27_15930 [Anaerolineales bacterium]|nr:hypothetical protein [Anaerolineales bacterium]
MPSRQNKTTDLHGVDLEYNSLRGEILKRIELRQQIISITLTLAGIFLSFGLSTDTVALIYPPLAAFLSIAWAQNDFRIRDLATYIRENLETVPIGLGYETYVQRARSKNKKLGAWRFVVISHTGIFIFTQLMAVGIELLKSMPIVLTPLEWVLIVIDFISILVVLLFAGRSSR